MITNEEIATVKVVAYRKAPGLHPELAVSPRILDLNSFPKGKVKVKWVLLTKGYSFPQKGAIVFTSPGAERNFGGAEIDCDGKVAVATAANEDGVAYAYSVTVVDESTGLVSVLDPIVQNNSQ